MLKKIACIVALATTAQLSLANPQLDALLESDWQWTLAHNPERATALGDRRYNHQLSNTTLAAKRQPALHESAQR